MTVLITGASGLIGTALSSELAAAGHRVVALRRGQAGRRGRPESADSPSWDPAAGRMDPALLVGVDAVVHLAAASVASRWTAANRARMVASRVEGTALLARTLAAAAPDGPRLLISASAVGYYGDRGDQPLEESTAPGSGFLADLAVRWEAAAEPARQAGLRVVHPRLGIVLSARGGALARMLPPFRLGLGAKLGNGRQYMPWITLRDATAVLAWLLEADSVSGPVNLVAPQAVTNAEFTAALTSALQRPALGWLPAPLLRMALGDMADEMLLASQRVVPARLAQAGYVFRDGELRSALQTVLHAGDG